jgi:hypothetical protein
MNKIKILFIFSLINFIGCNSSILDDPSTSIEFSVSELSYVKLTVENSYDTNIATLIDEELAAGRYSVNFDTSNLAEGIYFYTLELRGVSGSYFKRTKFMLLIK